MRRSFVSFFVLTFIIIGCSITNNKSEHSRLIGQWRWIRSTGGFAGETITPDSAGVSGHQFKFSTNHTFIFMRADTVVQYGLYQFYRSNEHTILNFQVTTNNFFTTQSVQFRGKDTLVLMDECYDCYINTYERVN